MDITLPLDYTAIERILPHRYPFLLVDRITELEPDKRIVGIKNVTLNERYLAHRAGRGAGAAAVRADRGGGAGRRDPDPGEAGEPREDSRTSWASSGCATAARSTPATSSRSRPSCIGCAAGWACCGGVARVDGKVVLEGTMTFALGPRKA